MVALMRIFKNMHLVEIHPNIITRAKAMQKLLPIEMIIG